MKLNYTYHNFSCIHNFKNVFLYSKVTNLLLRCGYVFLERKRVMKNTYFIK